MISPYAREAWLRELVDELDEALVIIRNFEPNEDEIGALGHVEYVIEQAANYLHNLRLQQTIA
jgi:hypothetical protein